MEQTLAIIKPDAVRAKFGGKIIDMIESHGFNIIEMKKLTLSKQQAEAFYDVHKSRPFFGELVQTMTSGPVVVMVLEKNNAIADWRTLMGPTDPTKASIGTVRRYFGASIGENAVHGSDAAQTAEQEIKLAKTWF